MLTKKELKILYNEVIIAIPDIKNYELEQIIVKVYHYLMDNYGDYYNKNDAKDIALCIYIEYNFLFN